MGDSSYLLVLQNTFEKKAFVYAPEEKEIIPVNANGFANAVHLAYTYHYPLVIGPDDIWLLICQGLANHVNSDPAKYESMVVKPNRPKTIFIRNDALPDLAAKDWKKLIEDFEQETRLYTQPKVNSLLVQEFSTTTPVIKTVYKATVLETLKTYFDFLSGSGCGIPYIRLTGSVADWEKIDSLAGELDQYDLAFWTKELKPVLKQFIDARKGNADIKFWKNIYKEISYYGVTHMNGWLLKLYPYLQATETLKENMETGSVMLKETFRKNPYLAGNDYIFSDITIHAFPKGYTHVPVTWVNAYKNPAETKNLVLRAGFMGLKQDKTSMEIGTHISWAFMDEDTEAQHVSFEWQPDVMHKNKVWYSIEIHDTANTWPVYHPQKNTNYKEGITELKNFLGEKLKANAAYAGSKGKIKIVFIVTWMGTVELIDVKGCNAALAKEIETTVKTLPYDWKPCYVRPQEFGPPNENGKPAPVLGNMRLKLMI